MGQPIQIRVIGKELTERLLRIDDVLSAVDETFQALGRGQIFHPVKEPIWLGEGGANMLLAMPAHLKEKHIVGVKWVNMYPIQQPGLPASYGNLLILSHEENGQPYALLEATAITAMRTAGGHAVVAARYLARKDARTLAVIGCGAEAQAGVRSFLHAMPGLEEVRLFDLRPEAMQTIQDQVGRRARVCCCRSAQEAVEPADIVVTVTTATKPIVQFDWLKKGAFVAGLYSFNDLDPACSRRADKWFLGSRETDGVQIVHAPRMAQYHLRDEDVAGDLGEVAAGLCPGRESEDEIIVYTHMGMGALDAAVGDVLFRRAEEAGLGMVIDLA